MTSYRIHDRQYSMERLVEKFLGKKINNTRIIPLTVKIVSLFTLFLLLSNFFSNYINLMLNRGEQIKLVNQLLIRDLQDIYSFTANQYEIYSFSQNIEEAFSAIEQNALSGMQHRKSIFLGIQQDGKILFQNSRRFQDPSGEAADSMERPSSSAAQDERLHVFSDARGLEQMNSRNEAGDEQGSISFRLFDDEYFGAYKYMPSWDVYLLRGEELNEFYSDSRRIFQQISILIFLVTIFCILAGVWLLHRILRFVGVITRSIMEMQEEQRIDRIDMYKAPNDEVTFLGIAFNSLSSTIDNLLTIFKKFVARDVAMKAYQEREIRLEGGKKDLSILFTDIRSFTYMTETLGTDIIKLLNMHYDQAIHHIHEHNGDIGSIIGDAVLAVFGTIPSADMNKSYLAIKAGYKIQEVAQHLRKEMHDRREVIIRQRGALSHFEEEVYRAVLLQVGIGIDGGVVFYGNIGSEERMVNTVIGDNVNSASRLEGLTKTYMVPIIVSEYIKNEVESATNEYEFLEIDQVQVKGKTQGKKIYWPIERSLIDDTMWQELEAFSSGLQLYYAGNWKEAQTYFGKVDFALSQVFQDRIKNNVCPKDWNGIWTMETK